MAEKNTFDALRAAAGASNPTDAQIKAALQEVLDALTLGGKASPVLVLDQSTAPTDAQVQTYGGGGREIFDGMLVARRSGSDLVLYTRVAGAWKAFV